MIKRFITKIQEFFRKRNQLNCLINAINNAKSEKERTDLILKLFNNGFVDEAVKISEMYYPIISNHYGYKDLKNDLGNIVKAGLVIVIGFLIVTFLTQ